MSETGGPGGREASLELGGGWFTVVGVVLEGQTGMVVVIVGTGTCTDAGERLIGWPIPWGWLLGCMRLYVIKEGWLAINW